MSGRCSSEGSNAGKALISTSVYTVIFRVILSSDFHRKKKNHHNGKKACINTGTNSVTLFCFPLI